MFDRVIEAFMDEHEIPAATFALSVDGEIVHTAAYGWCDAGESEPTTPLTPMRMASIAKPITAAVVHELIAEGKLSRETRVLDVIDHTPPAGHEMDPRFAEVTIGHLLEHRGGWDRAQSGDPMFGGRHIREFLEIDQPATADQIIRYMLAQPLDFDPGEREAYSNFGYCLLGRAIEAVEGKPFIDVVRERIGEPLGMDSLALGRTDVTQRAEGEVDYGPGNVLQVERMDAHGGLIANAPDLCRFTAAYWISGEPRQAGESREYAFFGGMPGTTALVRQLPGGIDYAVMFNRFPAEYADILPRLDGAADEAFDR